MKLSKLERVSLIHQHLIMRKLYPEDDAMNAQAIAILSEGYEYLYDDLYQYVCDGDDVMSEGECKEVWATLSMFDSIDRTIKDLGLKHDPNRTTKFFGYDGNNEAKFLGFAEFTVMGQGKFSYLPMARDNDFNSHMPARETYQRMIEAWEKIGSSARYPMSLENLDRVLAAAVHPSYR